jgi:ABC-type polysaccharide/polyol phosphate transport system ATPase subunit
MDSAMNSKDSELAIDVSGVGKRYRLKGGGGRSLKSAMVDVLRFRRQERKAFWALQDANFSVRRGETLGIIGANGAGKSTLLSLLAGTRKPTTGSIAMNGVVSSLLELGAGFHPDLTGRENVFLNGAIMGISKEAMHDRFDAIVEYSGIGEFIDQPVKNYSSGMYVRLGFAVAVEVDPDILLIDEVLAVGDSDFQQKCITKMEEFRAQGKTMLIISHDLPTIQRISDRILLLEKGKIMGLGDPDSLVDQYESLSLQKRIKSIEREWGTGEVKIESVDLLDDQGQAAAETPHGGSVTARITLRSDQPVNDLVVGFSIANEEGITVYGNNSQIEGAEIASVDGEKVISMRLGSLTLTAGNYLMSFSVHSSDHKKNYHRIDNRFPLVIEGGKAVDGVCYLPVEWTTS